MIHVKDTTPRTPAYANVMGADDDVELDSPTFVPSELTEFAGRDYVRKNRWAVSERKQR
jgi:hypothetical protein